MKNNEFNTLKTQWRQPNNREMKCWDYKNEQWKPNGKNNQRQNRESGVCDPSQIAIRDFNRKRFENHV